MNTNELISDLQEAYETHFEDDQENPTIFTDLQEAGYLTDDNR